MHTNSKLPHSLRLAIFFLRVALGLDFLYLGISSVFDPSLRSAFSNRSLGDLYSWLAAVPIAGSLQMVLAWAFLVIGGCLIAGFLTRLASIAGIALGVASLIPDITLANPVPSRFVGDNIIVILCLGIIMIARAGEYFGVDRFLRHHAPGKNEL
jgi:uncharacterized membrane protein YphA (DoxX/SURF4 family)